MATKNGTQYVRGIFQQRDLSHVVAKTVSPWFRRVRIVPTTKATANERRKRGKCRAAHLVHLTVVLAPLSSGLLKAKDHLFRDLRPHRSHIVDSLSSRRLFSKESTGI